jgi:DNA-binding response OmpR family regulator
MSKRVLIVEDEPVVALNYAEILRRAGHEIVGPAATIERALELVGREELDGAVLDIDLVGRSADPVAAALADRGVPFFFVSAFSPERLAPPFRQSHIVGKPCRAEELLEAAKSF